MCLYLGQSKHFLLVLEVQRGLTLHHPRVLLVNKVEELGHKEVGIGQVTANQPLATVVLEGPGQVLHEWSELLFDECLCLLLLRSFILFKQDRNIF